MADGGENQKENMQPETENHFPEEARKQIWPFGFLHIHMGKVTNSVTNLIESKTPSFPSIISTRIQRHPPASAEEAPTPK